MTKYATRFAHGCHLRDDRALNLCSKAGVGERRSWVVKKDDARDPTLIIELQNNRNNDKLGLMGFLKATDARNWWEILETCVPEILRHVRGLPGGGPHM